VKEEKGFNLPEGLSFGDCEVGVVELVDELAVEVVALDVRVATSIDCVELLSSWCSVVELD
jgi:hypothetical protein